MKRLCRLVCVLVLLLGACQSHPSTVTVIDGGQTYSIPSANQTLDSILKEAGITLGAHDRVLVDGIEKPLAADSAVVEVRRAVTLTLVTPQGQQTVETSALTVGQALSEAGVKFAQGDLLDPAAETRITQPLTVNLIPGRELTIFVGGQALKVRSAARTVGEALAEAGVPLIGLDVSSPPENEAPPADGQIRVIKVGESFEVKLESIPFEEEVTYSPDVPLGEKKTLRPGVEGISMTRERIRYEDGNEVSRKAEEKTTVREPQNRIVQGGEKIVLEPVGGNIPYKYWYATEMYASVYSPCESGTGGCSHGTASGAKAGHGIVAVDYSIYSYLAGMKVYIPGYGVATIGDTGGGPIIVSAFGVPRTKWIDLGFDDGKIVDMTGWVKVYFLEPAPAEVPYFLK